MADTFELFRFSLLQRNQLHIEGEEFKRSRRGLVTTSFVVILIFFTNFQINNLKLFGIDFQSTGNPEVIYWIGTVLLFYWALTFRIYLKSDNEIHAEKEALLEERIVNLNKIKDKIDEYNEIKKIFPEDMILTSEFAILEERAMKILIRYGYHFQRTCGARQWEFYAKPLEIHLPQLMCLMAYLILFYLILKPILINFFEHF